MTKTGQEQRLGGGGGAASARRQAGGGGSTIVRMNLFVLVRILFQYLERVDPSSLDLAKEVRVERDERAVMTDFFEHMMCVYSFFHLIMLRRF